MALTSYLPATFNATDPKTWYSLLVIAAIYYLYRRLFAPKRLRTVYSIHPLAPSFISGAYAAYQLGINETDFLISLYKSYGPVVYIPFPLKQHLVLSDYHVRQIYNGKYNRDLSFVPIRKQLSAIIFGTSNAKTFYSAEMETHLFPIHSKALAKGNLKDPIQRFQQAVENCVLGELDQYKDSVKEYDLVKWTYDMMFRASMAALFGDQLDVAMDVFQANFKAFDDGFPLLATGVIPSFLHTSLPSLNPVYESATARNYLNELFGEWAEKTNCMGLQERDVVKAMSDKAIDLHWSRVDIGSCILGDFWALLANNPYAVSWIMIYLIQAEPSLFKEVLEEVDRVDLSTTSPADASLPLLTSVIYETLRLRSSPFSIRKCMSARNQSMVFEDLVELKAGELIVCVPRVGHLDEEVWGPDAKVWDGKRFFDGPGSLGNEKSRRIHEVRAFGGGVSIVRDDFSLLSNIVRPENFGFLQCEGRNLAVAELKTLLVIVLQNLDFVPIPVSKQDYAARNFEELPCKNGHSVPSPRAKPGRRKWKKVIFKTWEHR